MFSLCFQLTDSIFTRAGRGGCQGPPRRRPRRPPPADTLAADKDQCQVNLPLKTQAEELCFPLSVCRRGRSGISPPGRATVPLAAAAGSLRPGDWPVGSPGESGWPAATNSLTPFSRSLSEAAAPDSDRRAGLRRAGGGGDCRARRPLGSLRTRWPLTRKNAGSIWPICQNSS